MSNPTRLFRKLEDRFMLRLRKCSNINALKRIQTHILVSSLAQSSYLATQIINLCNAYGSIDYATQVFNQVLDPNVFLYNAVIKAYTQNHHFLEAIDLYKQMLRCATFGDRFTYPFVLKSCAGLIHVQLGRQVHSQVIRSGLEFNPVTQNSLIEMYAKVDDLINARKVFHDMSDRDSVSWNTLISAHARLGQMRRAKALFDAMPSRTVVSWTALISGYTLEGRCSEAVAIFRRMQAEGFEPDDVSIVSVLPACVELGALELGRWIHTYAERHGLLQKMVVCNALIELHAKCGSIDDAIKLFDNMPQRDVISWSAMICGLAQHGRARKAVQLFETMKDENGVNPNSVTFLGLLAACAHGGLLDEGLHYFSLMKEIYGITTGVEHYGCIVDLLGRAGCIARAVEVVDNMSIPADAAIWGSLLSASRKHGDIETAVRSMEELMRLEPEDMGNYVLLSNTYAAEKRWEDVARIRILMRSRRLKKTPGCSSIEVGDAVHEFVAGEDSSLRSDELNGMLRLLAMVAGKGGSLSTMEGEEEIGFFRHKPES